MKSIFLLHIRQIFRENDWILPLLLLALTLPSAFANIENGGPAGGESGYLTITTVDTSNPNAVQTRSDQSYIITATYTIPDPSAKLVLERSYQVRSPGGVLGPVIQDPNNPYGRWAIPQNGFPQTRGLGTYSPIVQYGVETWTLCYESANGKYGPYCFDSQGQLVQVFTYPKTRATISSAMPMGATPTSLAGNHYNGDPPRAKVEIDNSYPGGTTWVVVYEGQVAASPPISITPVPNSSYTTPMCDLNPQRFVYVDIGNFVQKADWYTMQVIQNTQAYGPESLAAATIYVDPTFHVGGAIGLTK